MRGRSRSRASSAVIGNVLLIAIVVVLAATASAYLFGATDGSPDPAPTVAQSTGEFVPQDGNDGGVVRITHRGGDTLRVADLEIVVDAQAVCGKVGRLVNLPASGGDPQPTSEFVRGDDVFDNSFNSVTGPIGEDGRTVDGRWSSGETATFRLAGTECRLTSGESITVRVVHTPTNAVVIKQTLTA
ncbi:type IV pilin [Haloplanus salinarum]|uniref:type IV pilin n=1 Tax=Haloplanus salinarum TaxID=1912324 RepID=UPI00214AE5C4|nr:type IV pilin [Haloplanus salinarum]